AVVAILGEQADRLGQGRGSVVVERARNHPASPVLFVYVYGAIRVADKGGAPGAAADSRTAVPDAGTAGRSVSWTLRRWLRLTGTSRRCSPSRITTPWSPSRRKPRTQRRLTMWLRWTRTKAAGSSLPASTVIDCWHR